MALQLEAGRRELAQITRASLNLEDAVAPRATEMMMVLRPRAFVSRGLTRQLDRHQPSRLDQRVDCAIYGGDTQLRDMLATGLEHLKGTERSRDFVEDQSDRVPLSRVPFHRTNMNRCRVACRPDRVLFCAMTSVRRAWPRYLVLGLLALLVAHLLDPMAWRLLRLPRVNETDWGRLFRSMGYLPLWGFLALGLWLHEKGRSGAGRRAGLLVLSPMLAGAFAELCKMVVRRLRPDPELFGYVFRPFAEAPLSTRGLGMPSSHTIVAFAGAALLARMYPSSRWVWYTLAVGCGATRILSSGHFLSDVVAGAFLGIVATALLWSRYSDPSVATCAESLSDRR